MKLCGTFSIIQMLIDMKKGETSGTIRTVGAYGA